MRRRYLLLTILFTIILINIFAQRTVRKMIWFDFNSNTIEKKAEFWAEMLMALN